MHRIVGLDLTGDAVRLVALESGFRGFRVVRMAHSELPDEGTPAERLKAALAQLDGGGPVEGDAVAVSLPGALVASFPMSLPFTDLRRIEQVLPAEVEGAIPFDLDEVVWDYSILQQQEGKSELLVAVVRKQALRETLDRLSAAGVDPKVVTFGPLALAALGEKGLLAEARLAADRTEPSIDPAALASAEQGEPADAILDGGPDRADVCILRGGHAELARTLPGASRAAWEAAAADPNELQRLLGPLVRDLKLTVRARIGRPAPLRRLLLGGQLAHLPGASEHVAAQLGLPCGPLELSENAQLEGTVEDPAGYALALGLALRAQQPRGRLNFRKDEFAFTSDSSQLRGVVIKLSVAVAAVLLLALCAGLARLNSLQRQARHYDDALCKATEQILHKCHTDWREALGALRGGNSTAVGIPRVSATEVLGEVVQNLPEDALPGFEDVEVSTSRVTVRGQAADYAQVDKIKAALRKDRCFGEIKQRDIDKARESGKLNFSIEFAYTCAGETAGGT